MKTSWVQQNLHFLLGKMNKTFLFLNKNKNWGKNWESEDEFFGESDSDDEYVYCESSYNNPQNKESI